MKKRRDTVGEFVTRSEIATRLRVDKKTVSRWLREPGAPRPDARNRYSFTATSRWISDNAPRALMTEGMAKLRERAMALRVAAMEREQAVADGRFIGVATIEPQIVAICARMTADLQAVFEAELPPKYIARSVVECRELNANGVDRVLRTWKAGCAAMAGPNPPPSLAEAAPVAPAGDGGHCEQG